MTSVAWRLSLVVAVAASLGLAPVLFPLGDPYDTTAEGLTKNWGYFAGHNGTAWLLLSLTFALWVKRIVAVDIHFRGAVLLPTLFAAAVFLGAYVVCGGPVPLATATLGVPCCLFVAWALSTFMIQRTPADFQAIGSRLLKSGAVWGLQLWLYLGFTLLVINVPQYHELQASVFAIALELVIWFHTDATSGHRDSTSEDQQNSARLLPALFVGLHAMFNNLLFPLLASHEAVIAAAVTSCLVNTCVVVTALKPLDKQSFHGQMAAHSFADFLFTRFIVHAVSIAAPVLLAAIVSWNVRGWNKGMFYSVDNLDTDPEDLHVFYVGCTINLCSALLSALLSTLAVRSWALRASSGSADSDDVEASSAAAAEEESARETVLCSLRRARHLIGLSLQLGCCHSDKTALPASDHDAENGAEAEAKQPQARGQAELLILSLATVTTVVGAAVLSKHDGMAISGWFDYLSGSPPPYNFTAAF